MIIDEKEYAKIGERIFPVKKEGSMADFYYKDAQVAFGLLASMLQKAEDEAKYCRQELLKREEQILAEYKASIEPRLQGSLYTMTKKETRAGGEFFYKHEKLHNQNLKERVYHLYETSLGPGIKCECPICHQVEDITDTEAQW